MITALFQLLDFGLNLFKWALILAAVFSMLTAFNVLDSRNRMVWTVGDFLYRVTDPLLRPIRNVLPSFGNVDVSPIILIALIEFLLRPLLRSLYIGIVSGSWQPLFF